MEKSNEILQLGGPHYKVCECGCETEFYGRKNQKYVDSTHKSRVNNLKRQNNDDLFRSTFSQIRLNYHTLIECLLLVDKDGWVAYRELVKLGFDPDAPFGRAWNKDRNIEFKSILDVAFRLSDNKDYVQIFKIKS